jgi:HEAT repeat protein
MQGLDFCLSELFSNDDNRAELAAQQISSFGDTAVLTLQETMTSPNSDIRWWSVRALAEFDSQDTTALLVRSLEDSEPDVRQCAAQGLATQADPNSIPALINALNDEDSLVTRLAANALIRIGEASVLPLIGLIKAPDSPARFEAMRALALIADERSVPTLFDALNDDAILVNYWANVGLERLGIGMQFYSP